MPQISQNMNPVKSTATALAKVFADLTGAGAAAPTVPTGPTVALPHLLAPRDNFATTREGNATGIVRNAAGDYTFTFPTAPPSAAKVMDIDAVPRGATALKATVQSWAVTNGRLVVNVKTWTPAGVATDLANGTDFLRIAIEFDLSNA